MKNLIRKEALNKRLELTAHQVKYASKHVVNQVVNDSKFLSSVYVGLYFPHKNEIDITELMSIYPNKKYLFPKIHHDSLIYVLVDKTTVYEKSKYGIIEPVNSVDSSQLIEYLLIPLIAVNDQLHRIGYGKGYFDRFLSKHNNVYKVGVTYSSFVYDFIHEEHDVKLDRIIKGDVQE